MPHGQICKGRHRSSSVSVSDLTTSKKRPAVVVAPLTGDDILVCQITSKTIKDQHGVAVSSADFTTGNLRQDSNIRPNRIFTADSAIVLYRAGTLTPSKMAEVTAKIVEIVTA